MFQQALYLDNFLSHTVYNMILVLLPIMRLVLQINELNEKMLKHKIMNLP